MGNPFIAEYTQILMKKGNELGWLNKLVQRRLVVVSGLLAWGVGYNTLRAGRYVLAEPSWQPLVARPLITDGLFFLLLLFGVSWMAWSLLALRSLARRPELREWIQEAWWTEPLLLQILAFSEHWIMATFYFLATGDAIRGRMLGWLSALHILIVLLVGPAWVERYIKQEANEVTGQADD